MSEIIGVFKTRLLKPPTTQLIVIARRLEYLPVHAFWFNLIGRKLLINKIQPNLDYTMQLVLVETTNDLIIFSN